MIVILPFSKATKAVPVPEGVIQDPNRLKIVTKARRIGYSFAAGADAVFRCWQEEKTFIVLSRSERLSTEFIEQSVVPHVRALGILAEYAGGTVPQTSISKQEVRISKGRILAFPANADTARSYEGDILLDEFAFHQDARAIYEAIAPSIARGYSLSIISTPNGQQGAYYDLASEAGLVDGIARSDRWSTHKTDIFEAIKQGCADRFGNPLNPAELRADCIDEEMWQQEYLCQFLSIALQWISPELFAANVSEEAHDGRPDGSYRRTLYWICVSAASEWHKRHPRS